jgi:DNA-binding transcriptional ArsR family regulator
MQISDPLAIRALAHPLRLDLLDLLVAIGPATAARCGRVLGVPQANCSFHLRQLAKYGFVEDAGPGDDRRERQWRMPDPRLSFRAEDSAGLVSRQLQQVVVQRSMQAILDYAERLEGDSEEWRRAAGLVAGVAVMTAAEAAEVRAQCKALLEPYFARAVAGGLKPQAGQRHVRFFVAGTPLPDLDRPGHDDPDEDNADHDHPGHQQGTDSNHESDD